MVRRIRSEKNHLYREIPEAKQCFFVSPSRFKHTQRQKERAGPGNIFWEPCERALPFPHCNSHLLKASSGNLTIIKFISEKKKMKGH